MVHFLDEFKKDNDTYTPSGLYRHIDRMKDIPELYTSLVKEFKSKRKRNMTRLLLIIINDIEDDFGLDPSVAQICYTISHLKSLAEMKEKSYFHLLLEVQNLINV